MSTTRRHRRNAAFGHIGIDPLAGDPTRPRYHAAAVHRIITTLTRTPTDPFFGCAFPTCPCQTHCPIHATLPPTETPT